jgi:hypothetical protein
MAQPHYFAQLDRWPTIDWVPGKVLRCLTDTLLNMVWPKGKSVKHFLCETSVDKSKLLPHFNFELQESWIE